LRGLSIAKTIVRVSNIADKPAIKGVCYGCVS